MARGKEEISGELRTYEAKKRSACVRTYRVVVFSEGGPFAVEVPVCWSPVAERERGEMGSAGRGQWRRYRMR